MICALLITTDEQGNIQVHNEQEFDCDNINTKLDIDTSITIVDKVMQECFPPPLNDIESNDVPTLASKTEHSQKERLSQDDVDIMQNVDISIFLEKKR